MPSTISFIPEFFGFIEGKQERKKANLSCRALNTFIHGRPYFNCPGKNLDTLRL